MRSRAAEAPTRLRLQQWHRLRRPELSLHLQKLPRLFAFFDADALTCVAFAPLPERALAADVDDSLMFQCAHLVPLTPATA